MSDDTGNATNDGGLINIDLSNLANLADPVDTLIEKIAEGAGHVYAPIHERRMAEAETESRKIRASAQLEIAQMIEDELDIPPARAASIARVMGDKSFKLENRDEIIRDALPNIEEDARPEDISDDWLLNFFDRCELTSDEEIQTAWSKVLSGEANNPGTYSKRTLDILSKLDKKDAIIFRDLCNYMVSIDFKAYPIITDVEDEIYSDSSITFENLKRLDNIGLISHNPLSGYKHDGSTTHTKEKSVSFIRENSFNIILSHEGLEVGSVILSDTGTEISTVVESESIKGFRDHVESYFLGQSQVERVEIENRPADA